MFQIQYADTAAAIRLHEQAPSIGRPTERQTAVRQTGGNGRIQLPLRRINDIDRALMRAGEIELLAVGTEYHVPQRRQIARTADDPSAQQIEQHDLSAISVRQRNGQAIAADRSCVSGPT